MPRWHGRSSLLNDDKIQSLFQNSLTRMNRRREEDGPPVQMTILPDWSGILSNRHVGLVSRRLMAYAAARLFRMRRKGRAGLDTWKAGYARSGKDNIGPARPPRPRPITGSIFYLILIDKWLDDKGRSDNPSRFPNFQNSRIISLLMSH